MKIALEGSFRLRSAGLSWAPADNEVIVLDLETSQYLSSNETGKVLWELLADGATTDELASALVDACGIDLRTAQVDAEAFVHDLTARALVERVG